MSAADSAPARGTLHLVVGPSGAGKDTLIDAARTARPDMDFPRRTITRPETAGGEPHEAATPEGFADRVASGQFALHWRAHDLRYGIPAAIEASLADGRHVLVNVSRSVVEAARTRFAPLRILVVTAPEQVLARRLAGRGRETADDIAARLARAPYALPEGPDVCVIDNGGRVEDSIAAFLAALAPVHV